MNLILLPIAIAAYLLMTFLFLRKAAKYGLKLGKSLENKLKNRKV